MMLGQKSRQMTWVSMQAHLLFLLRHYYSVSLHSSLCRDIVSLCRDIAGSMFVVACVATFFFNIFNFSPFIFVATLLVYVATQFLNFYNSLCHDNQFLCRNIVSHTAALFYVAT